jgi:glutamate 5-kinase
MNKLIVIKIGSSLVANKEDSLDLDFIRSISSQIRDITEKGSEVLVVTSGAIAQGMKSWGMKIRPTEIDKLQALSAVGQIGLINAYQQEFRIHGMLAAQVLMSHSDFKDADRSKNIQMSLKNIFSLGAIPIINENDSVSTEEIKHGDNDQLSGEVAKLIGADALIILTDQDGVFDCDPRKNSNAKLISSLALSSMDEQKIEFGKPGEFGRGGMETKIKAAKNYLQADNVVWIANGRADNAVMNILGGEKIGTKITLTLEV